MSKKTRSKASQRHLYSVKSTPISAASRLFCPNCGSPQMCWLTWAEWADHARAAGEPMQVWAVEPAAPLLDTPWPYWWCSSCCAGGPLLASA